MANDDEPLDLTPFLTGTPIVCRMDDAECDEWMFYVKGVKRLGPVEITGRWDDGRETCAVCHEPFTPGPEGRAFVECGTERIGPVCPACGAAVVSGGPVSP